MATIGLAPKTKPTTPKTGIEAKDRAKIAKALETVLADTYTLLVKTHVYHWNVVGPLFLPLHHLTEEHYKDLFAAADEIAERIRALGKPAPVSFEALLPRASVEEETTNRSAGGMIEQLIEDHENIVTRLREAALSAEEADDLVTTDMLTARMAFHEKAIWMLRATANK
ncbi:MAG: DNA starvation/stationary phase protection protein [Hyphomicrobiaceae bacterium]|nr:DNA starvation/stationary phase protection protein [Hyphomicrobiaceae bacterium]